jgi:predicted GIY-YIG superfamily endonuclease
MNKSSYVYILTNEYNTAFYVDVTSTLIKRIFEHKEKFLYRIAIKTITWIFAQITHSLHSAEQS